jgi:hypothetical protein
MLLAVFYPSDKSGRKSRRILLAALPAATFPDPGSGGYVWLTTAAFCSLDAEGTPAAAISASLCWACCATDGRDGK